MVSLPLLLDAQRATPKGSVGVGVRVVLQGHPAGPGSKDTPNSYYFNNYYSSLRCTLFPPPPKIQATNPK